MTEFRQKRYAGSMKNAHLVVIALLALAGCSQAPPAAIPTSATPTVSSSPRGDRAERNKERYKKRFEEMDTNHDGKLSDEEKSVGLDKLLETNKRMFDRVDTDKDGKISAEEKAEYLKKFMKPRKPREEKSEAQSE